VPIRDKKKKKLTGKAKERPTEGGQTTRRGKEGWEEAENNLCHNKAYGQKRKAKGEKSNQQRTGKQKKKKK